MMNRSKFAAGGESARQLTLFGQSISVNVSRPPTGKVGTSKAAADFIAEKSPTIRERVLQFIAGQGTDGATADECELALGLRTPTVTARINELRKAGSIIRSGHKRETRSGCEAHVYVVTRGI